LKARAIKIPSEAEESQFIQACYDEQVFVNGLVKKYPLVFKNGTGGITIHPTLQLPFCPYTIKLEITKKE